MTDKRLWIGSSDAGGAPYDAKGKRTSSFRPGDIIAFRSPGELGPYLGSFMTPPHPQSPEASQSPFTPQSPMNFNAVLDEFETVPLYDDKPVNFNVLEEFRVELAQEREVRPIPPSPPRTPYYVTAAAALAGTSLLAYNAMRRKRDDEREEMTKEQLEEMALHKDMIEVQYANRVSAGRDFFTSSSERTAIPESTLQDDRKLDVGDYKFVEASDLYALFENEKINKRVLAIRGLRPDIDKKDLKQLPRMGAQTLLKMNLDTDLQYKKDYEEVEDYLLNLPNYKDVVITGHSRGGQTGLELARKHRLKAHIFQPVTVRNIEATDSRLGIVGMKDSSLTDDSTITFTLNQRHIYTNKEDTTPSNLVNPRDTSEKQYIIDYDPSLHTTSLVGGNADVYKQFSAHKLNNFHKDAVGYAASSKNDIVDFGDDMDFNDYPVNRLTEQEAAEMGYDMTDDDYDIEEDFSIEEYVNVRNNDLIVPVSKRSLLFSDIPFIPNTSPMQKDTLDTNGDGLVSYNEFYTYYKKKGFADIRIKKLFKSLDLNNDGVLSPNEII